MHPSYKKYFLILFVCALMVCCTSYQSHVEKHTADLYEEEPSTDTSDGGQPLLTPDAPGPASLPTIDQIAAPGKLERFTAYWDKLTSRLSNYWWIILLSTLLPMFMLWRIESSIGKKTPSWKKPYAESHRQNPKNRRPTLPDLTLAKHARRESDQQRMRSPIRF